MRLALTWGLSSGLCVMAAMGDACAAPMHAATSTWGGSKEFGEGSHDPRGVNGLLDYFIGDKKSGRPKTQQGAGERRADLPPGLRTAGGGQPIPPQALQDDDKQTVKRGTAAGDRSESASSSLGSEAVDAPKINSAGSEPANVPKITADGATAKRDQMTKYGIGAFENAQAVADSTKRVHENVAGLVYGLVYGAGAATPATGAAPAQLPATTSPQVGEVAGEGSDAATDAINKRGVEAASAQAGTGAEATGRPVQAIASTDRAAELVVEALHADAERRAKNEAENAAPAQTETPDEATGRPALAVASTNKAAELVVEALAADEERKATAEAEAKAKAEDSAKPEADAEAEAEADAEAKAKAEEEAKAKAEADAQAKAEEEAAAKAAAELALAAALLAQVPAPVVEEPPRLRFADLVKAPNQKSVARAVDSLPETHPLYDGALDALDNDNLERYFDSLSGEVHATVATTILAVSSLAREVPMAQLRDNLTAKMIPGAPTAAWGDAPAGAAPYSSAKPVWAQVGGNWQRVGGRDHSARGDQNSVGLFLGTDHDMGNGWRLGGALGFTDSHLKVGSLSSKANTSSYSALLYGGKVLPMGPGALHAIVGSGYTWNDVKTKRQANVGSLDQTLRAKYGVSTVQWFAELGYSLPVAEGLILQPYAGLAYGDNRRRGFKEHGGSAALSGRHQRSDTTTSTLGLRARQDIKLGAVEGQWTAGLGWRRNTGDVHSRTHMSFAMGDGFTVTGAPVARNVALVETGAKFNLNKNTALGVNYAGQFGGGQRNNTVSLNLGYRF